MQRHFESAFSWSQARNSQKHIDSTTGVVLAPEVQPGLHQVISTSDGTDVYLPIYATPAEAWWDKVTCSKSQYQGPG